MCVEKLTLFFFFSVCGLVCDGEKVLLAADLNPDDSDGNKSDGNDNGSDEQTPAADKPGDEVEEEQKNPMRKVSACAVVVVGGDGVIVVVDGGNGGGLIGPPLVCFLTATRVFFAHNKMIIVSVLPVRVLVLNRRKRRRSKVLLHPISSRCLLFHLQFLCSSFCDFIIRVHGTTYPQQSLSSHVLVFRPCPSSYRNLSPNLPVVPSCSPRNLPVFDRYQ